ncbi:hypothetical protein [Streptomyces sp. YKOK-I1]
MKKSSRTGLLALTAGLFLAVGTSPASAASYAASCSTTGATGSLYTSGWEYNDKTIPYVSMAVADTKADKWHVAIRLVTAHASGETTYWPWHHWYGGNDTATVWESSATSLAQIVGFSVEVARFKGKTLKNYCSARAY